MIYVFFLNLWNYYLIYVFIELIKIIDDIDVILDNEEIKMSKNISSFFRVGFGFFIKER